MRVWKMSKKIVIIGASGHGKVVADIAKKNGYDKIVFLDDKKEIIECSGYPVVGNCNAVKKYKDFDFVIAIGNSEIRQKIYNNLVINGIRIVTLIHPNAVIGKGVTIDCGTVIMAGVVINSDTSIGVGCIINTCSSIDHDCRIGNFVHVSVGSHISGTVHVDERTWIGAGATIVNNVNITSNCMIGAGAVVISDINKSGTYIGVPARMK